MLNIKYLKKLPKNVKVLLDGQGADECLCGYEGYPEYYIEDLIWRF